MLFKGNNNSVVINSQSFGLLFANFFTSFLQHSGGFVSSDQQKCDNYESRRTTPHWVLTVDISVCHSSVNNIIRFATLKTLSKDRQTTIIPVTNTSVIRIEIQQNVKPFPSKERS